MSPAAWQGFSLLRSLLDPFQRAMEGVMARTATVAEVARQWLRLAAALNAEAAALDPGPSPRMIPSRDGGGGKGGLVPLPSSGIVLCHLVYMGRCAEQMSHDPGCEA